MAAPLHLTSLSNPRVKAMVRLREQRHRRLTGLFVAEGEREIGRALCAGLRLVELYWSPSMVGASQLSQLAAKLPELARLPTDARCFTLTDDLLTKTSYCENPRGILGVFEQPRWRLDDLPDSADGLFLIATAIAKPGNLGAMARSAEAAGAAALIVADAVVDPFNPNAIRASTGAVFCLPIVSAPAAEALNFLARRGVTIVAADPEASVPYTAVDLTGRIALAVGAEDRGLDRCWLEGLAGSTDVGQPPPRRLAVSIPMQGRLVDSLNASVAAGILLFEAVRQRRAGR